tara:strand:+ start:6035 stop:6463 length:429 start_codon:yes stop_codon:yes gene_type:complete
MRYLFVFLFLSFHAHAAELDLKPYKGKVVYVDFWASWCAPCKLSFPWMQKMQEKYGDKGFVVVTVNVDEDKSDATEFLQGFPKIQFPVIYDPDSKLVAKYNVEVLPWSLIFDREGKLVSQHRGFTSKKKQKYEAEIRKYVIP